MPAVLVGECAGWKPKGPRDATVDGIAQPVEAILSTERPEIPAHPFEEMRYLSRLRTQHERAAQ